MPYLLHAVSYHVAMDKPPRPKWRQVPVYFSDSLQPIATRGKKARGTLLVDKHCFNGCSIERAPLSVSYYNEISGGHTGRAVVRRRCSAGPVLPLCLYLQGIRVKFVYEDQSQDQGHRSENCRRPIFPQCKISIGNNRRFCNTYSREVYVKHVVFGYGGSNGVTAIVVT